MNHKAYLRAAAGTPFGKHTGASTLDLMASAGAQALHTAKLERSEIDGLLCGYSTTLPHLMLSTLFAERFGLRPSYAHSMQLGGATGAAMLMAARGLVLSGQCDNVLVVAGENRLSGQSRDSSIQTLAQVGEAVYEVPNGASVPAYYALMASEYMHLTGTRHEDLAEFAVLMRHHASSHPGAHLKAAITLDDVLQSKSIASPLGLLDCCPISDGAMAVVVSRMPNEYASIAIQGAGQAHLHQHLTAMQSVMNCGASCSSSTALKQARLSLQDIDYLGIYDSFTITLVMLLEEIGFAKRGQAASALRAGAFQMNSERPLNTHGGLLSYGHCGVAGGMAHVLEAWTQMSGLGKERQLQKIPATSFIHADGGVMSSHVSLVLSRES